MRLPPDIRRELEKACSVYRGFHWGLDPKETLLFKGVMQIPRTVVILGELNGVIYETVKGTPDNPVLYVHSFDFPKPYLCCDTGMRRLFILGGGYTIENRGIVH